MRLVDFRIRVKARIRHDAIDEIVRDGRDGIPAAQAFVRRWALGDPAFIARSSPAATRSAVIPDAVTRP